MPARQTAADTGRPVGYPGVDLLVNVWSMNRNAYSVTLGNLIWKLSDDRLSRLAPPQVCLFENQATTLTVLAPRPHLPYIHTHIHTHTHNTHTQTHTHITHTHTHTHSPPGGHFWGLVWLVFHPKLHTISGSKYQYFRLSVFPSLTSPPQTLCCATGATVHLSSIHDVFEWQLRIVL